MSKTDLISIEKIEKAIYVFRGQKVMLDRDLADLYGVSTAALNQAMLRNRERFPQDFMFQLTSSEVAELNRSQIVIGSQKHRNPRLRPYAFTEQGVAMLSSVLRSKRAITVNIEIMRAFVKLRELFTSNAELALFLLMERSRSQIVTLKKVEEKPQMTRINADQNQICVHPRSSVAGTVSFLATTPAAAVFTNRTAFIW